MAALTEHSTSEQSGKRKLTQSELESVLSLAPNEETRQKLQARLSNRYLSSSAIPNMLQEINNELRYPTPKRPATKPSNTYANQRKLTPSELESVLSLVADEKARHSLAIQLADRYFLISAIPDTLQQAKTLAQSSASTLPRKLTDQEIQYIIDSLPKVIGADKEAAQLAQSQLMDKLRQSLSVITMTPLGIPELIAELSSKFERSRATPGSTVGVTTGEAFGAQATQMTLNTFHAAGSAKNVSAGIGRFRELIRASPNPKHVSCTIAFRQRLTFEQIMTTKRAELVDISIQDVIKDFHIDSVSSLLGEEPDWYQIFRNLIRGDIPYTGFLLRLQLDVAVLYAHRIRMVDIASLIESGTGVVVVYSPLNIGIIDIYPKDEVLEASDQVMGREQAAIIFLETIVLPKIGPLRIKGIPGIKGLFPVTVPVMSIVKSEEKLDDGNWLLKYNTNRLYVSGVTISDLVKLVTDTGLEIVPNDKYKHIGLVVKSETSPIAHINKLVAEKEDLGKFLYADTVGTNYKVLLGRDDVDQRYTTSNNVHEILETLGIEAARNFLFLEIQRVISAEGSYINPRHIGLLVEFMTNQGPVLPITYYGIQRQPIGTLALASFERSMNVFKSSAAYGREEGVSSTSTSIYVGKRAPIGTGYMDVISQPIPEPDTRVTPQSINEAIWRLQNITLDADYVNRDTDMEEMFAASTPPMITKQEERPGTVIIRSLPPAPPSLSHPVPVVSDQLAAVNATINNTGIPCLPPVEEVVSSVAIPSLQTTPVNRNLRLISTTPQQARALSPQMTSSRSLQSTSVISSPPTRNIVPSSPQTRGVTPSAQTRSVTPSSPQTRSVTPSAQTRGVTPSSPQTRGVTPSSPQTRSVTPSSPQTRGVTPSTQMTSTQPLQTRGVTPSSQMTSTQPLQTRGVTPSTQMTSTQPLQTRSVTPSSQMTSTQPPQTRSVTPSTQTQYTSVTPSSTQRQAPISQTRQTAPIVQPRTSTAPQSSGSIPSNLPPPPPRRR